jgi:hypothetical protein
VAVFTWICYIALEFGFNGGHGMGRVVASVSRLLVLLMASYAFASRVGIHNSDCTNHLVCSFDPYNMAVSSLLDQF